MKNLPASRKYRPVIASESMILDACIKLIFAKGCYCWRENTGGYKPEGSKRYIRYGTPGAADIIGVLPTGRFLAVETKSEKGKQTDKQRLFQERVEACKGVYLLVHSVEELEQGLKPFI